MKFATGARVTHQNDPSYLKPGYQSKPVVGTVIRSFGPGWGREGRVHVSWPERSKFREPWWYGEHHPSLLKCVTNK